MDIKNRIVDIKKLPSGENNKAAAVFIAVLVGNCFDGFPIF